MIKIKRSGDGIGPATLLLMCCASLAPGAGAQLPPWSKAPAGASSDLCLQGYLAANAQLRPHIAPVCQLEIQAADAARAGRWDEEATLLDRAIKDLSVLRLNADDPSLAAISTELDRWRGQLGHLLGARLSDQGAYDEARSILDSTVIWFELAQASSNTIASAFVALARVGRDAGHATASAAWLQKARAALDDEDPSSLVTARIHQTLARLALDKRDFGAAADDLAAARRLLENSEPPPRVLVDQLSTEGVLAARQGDLDGAHRLFAKAQDLLEASGAPSPRFAKSLNNLGALAFFQGDLVAAQDYLERAVALDLQFVPDGHTARASLANLGAVLKNRGRFDEAEVVLRRVVELAENEPPESRRLADAHEALGKLYYNRRDYDRAAVEYDQALAEGGPEALLLAHMGQLAQLRGDLPGGMALLRQAEELLEHQPDDGTYLAFIEHEQAAGLRRSGDLDGARAKAQSALQRYRSLNSSVNVSSALTRLAEIEVEAGRLEAAKAVINESLDWNLRFAPKSAKAARSSSFLGEVLRLQGDIATAESLICGATDQLESLTLASGAWEDDRTTFREAHVRIYRLCADVLARGGKAGRAIEVMERLRGQSLRTQLAERFVDLSAAVPSDLRARLVRNRTLLERESARRDAARAQFAFEAEERAPEKQDVREDKGLEGALQSVEASIQQLREQRSVLFEELRAAAPMLAELQTPRAPTVKELAAAVPAGGLRLSYVTGEESTWLLVLSPDGKATAIEVPISRRMLETLVEQHDQALRLPSLPDEYLAPSRRLGELLVQPALARLEQQGQIAPLLIAPDGPLHRVPFGALRVVDRNDDARFLVEIASPSFVLVGESSTLPHKMRSIARPEEPRLVVMADPTVELSDSPGAPRSPSVWPALPGARREANEIASLFSGAGVFVGEGATLDTLLREAPTANVLHLAVHATVDSNDPLGSALFLAASGGAAVDEANVSSRVEAWELAEDLSLVADLVTLAACETAQGRLHEGEGLLGLMRTFRLVGARRVVASLWRISDQATSGLMVDFYRRLRRGQEPDVALAAAQRTVAVEGDAGTNEAGGTTRSVGGLRASDLPSDRTWVHPYYWAAFQIYQ